MTPSFRVGLPGLSAESSRCRCSCIQTTSKSSPNYRPILMNLLLTEERLFLRIPENWINLVPG